VTGTPGADLVEKFVQPSDTLQLSADTQRSGRAGVPSGEKQFFIPYGGAVRVKWQATGIGTNAEFTARSLLDACVVTTPGVRSSTLFGRAITS
jgi:hypothetical protein